jgi:excisionase family DNA binding protein
MEGFMNDEALTVREAAQRLKVNEDTVRRWLTTGKLRGNRLGATRAGWRIPAREVERLIHGESAT